MKKIKLFTLLLMLCSIGFAQDLPTKAGSIARAYVQSPSYKQGYIEFNVDDALNTTMLTNEWHAWSGAYYDDRLYTYDLTSDNTVIFQIIEPSTGKLLKSIVRPELAGYHIAAMSYDYSSGTMYALRNAMIYTVNLRSGELTYVTALSNVSGFLVQCMAIDLQGNMYVIDGNDKAYSNLYSVNKTNGNATVIGSTGKVAVQSQSMAFDYNTGTLYWANYMFTSQIHWYSLDTETGVPTFLKAGIDQLHALHFVYFNLEGDAPGAVTGLSVTSGASGALNADVNWTNPSKNYYGDPITSLTSVEVYLDDSLVYTKANPTTGDAEQINITFEQAGEYEFKVVASNAAGEGKTTRKRLWVGRDVPAAPTDVIATYLGDDISLAWTAPTTGLHNAYCDLTELKYNIVRNPGKDTVAMGYTGLTFTDDTISEIGVYTYSVTAVNADGAGGTALSNPSMGGGTLTVPYSCSFEDVASLNLWPTIDNGGDGMWRVSPSNPYTGINCVLYNFGQQAADDWLFSPLLSMEAGKKYKISFWLKTVDGYPENLELYLTNGQHPEAVIGEKIWFKEGLTHLDHKQYGAVVEIASAGNYGFAYHCYSDALQGYLCMDDISVEEVDGPADASITALYGTDNAVAGEPFIYRVQVANLGFSSLSNYNIKLLDGSGNTLSTIAGPDIAPLAQANVKLVWTPASAGDISIHAVIDTAGDPDITNNTSQTISVAIEPSGASAYSTKIGEGSVQSYYIPFNLHHNNSWVQTIYYDFELIGREGFIEQIQYFNNFVSNYSDGKRLRVYMANTSEVSLSNSWLDTSEFELVYDGEVSLPAGRNTISITLDAPFKYTGDNLVILTNRDFQNLAGNQNDIFYNTPAQEDFPSRTRYYYAYTDCGDGPLPSTGDRGQIAVYYSDIAITMGLTTGSASGKITDGTNPVEGATVKISSSGRTRTTDANGEYTFNYLTSGDYTFEASKKGYFPVTSPNVTVSGGGAAAIPDLTLELIPVYSISGKVRSYDMPEGLDSVTIQFTGYDTMFTCVSDAAGNFTVSGVPNTFTYEVAASKEGYSVWTGNVTLEGVNITDFNFMMTENLYTAGEIDVEIVNDNAVINWLAAGTFVETEYIFDDGDVEQGQRISPGYDGWLGNLFDVGESGFITGVQVMGNNAYSDAGLDSVTLDIFDKNRNYIGTSEPFLMLDKEWVYATVPNLPYEGTFYAMVHWNKLEGFTCFLGIDETGPAAGDEKDLRFMDGVWTKMMHGFFGIRVMANSTGTIVNMPVQYGSELPSVSAVSAVGVEFVKGFSITAPEAPVIHRAAPTSKSVKSYSIYRVEPGQTNQAEWTKLDSNFAATTYTDDKWSTLPDGYYQYAVVTKYSGDILSKPRLSDRIGKNVSTEINADGKLFSVYPNPVKDVLNIYTDNIIVEIIVADQNGRVVKVQKGDEKSLNLSALSKGSYIVSVRTDKGNSSVKIIKQ